MIAKKRPKFTCSKEMTRLRSFLAIMFRVKTTSHLLRAGKLRSFLAIMFRVKTTSHLLRAGKPKFTCSKEMTRSLNTKHDS
jgi:hypothetical protein